MAAAAFKTLCIPGAGMHTWAEPPSGEAMRNEQPFSPHCALESR